jgi:hypothetical protein
MVTTVTVAQAQTSQGSSTQSQYVNKVSIAADGTMTVTKQRLVPANVVTALPTTAIVPSSNNQIVAKTNINTVASMASPKTVTTDSQGIVVNPQPPGPPVNYKES